MLAVCSPTHFFQLSSKITAQNQYESPLVRCRIPVRKCCSGAVWFIQRVDHRFCLFHMHINHFSTEPVFGISWTRHKRPFSCQAVSAALEDNQTLSSETQEFSVTTCSTDKPNELKINVDVSSTRTQAVFDVVFSKMVADAQPIPGFRRVKGGKTPDIPKDVLLEILGPSRVYRQVIKKVINSTISEYIKNEDLKVKNDLKVEQSVEDLEAVFEPGEHFRFDATLQLE